jgi:hypothetical protein
MELLGDVGRVEYHFFLFWDSVSVGAMYVHSLRQRTLGSEFILDAPDGTPRWWGSSESSACLEIVLILMQDSAWFVSNVP